MNSNFLIGAVLIGGAGYLLVKGNSNTEDEISFGGFDNDAGFENTDFPSTNSEVGKSTGTTNNYNFDAPILDGSSSSSLTKKEMSISGLQTQANITDLGNMSIATPSDINKTKKQSALDEVRNKYGGSSDLTKPVFISGGAVLKNTKYGVVGMSAEKRSPLQPIKNTFARITGFIR